MAPAKDKWVRRFIIPVTTRHKKGFTIYKVTSMVFLKSSHEEISKISVWKRYNDFKRLHSELSVVYSKSQGKECFPKLPKSKFFGRFEAEVIQERREYALKFLDFIGRHACLYSSDIFIKFFETSHLDNDCSQSVSSDTSEDDHQVKPVTDIDYLPQDILQQAPINDQGSKETPDINLTRINGANELTLPKKVQPLNGRPIKTNENLLDTGKTGDTTNGKQNTVPDGDSINGRNNNVDMINSMSLQTTRERIDVADEARFPVNTHDGSDLPQSWSDSSQYILIAAAHMSAAFRHEAMGEYEEAFTQYKMGISNLLTGVQSDTDTMRAQIIKEKIAKYLERAEKLYNRHLNCNVSQLSKPAAELQNYKVLKIMRSVMLVRDLRQNCLRIVKAVEKSCGNREGISNYILRGQVPYMVRLHACIETETTVFLILDYVKRGKLWDFITTEYKCGDDSAYHVDKVHENVDTVLDVNSITLRENGIEEVLESINIPVVRSEFTSTSPRVQTSDCPLNVEETSELYTSDVSTTQLLEKAQMLLQSVNATLKESNTITSRLHEYNGLLTREDTTSLNLMNTTRQQEKWDMILTQVRDVPLESHSIINIEPQQRMLTVKNSSSLDDMKNDKSPDVTDSSSLTDSYTDLSFSERDSSSYSLDYSKSISAYDKPENLCDLSKSLRIECNIEENNYVIADEQMQSLVTEYTRSNSSDMDKELWSVPEKLARIWTAEILLALEALHQQEVIVFDLKPDNILLDDSGHVQLSYITPYHNADFTKHKQPYASPELRMFLPTVPVTTASDIWSFGVILYELLIGNKFQTMHPGPFHSHSIINIPSKLCESAKSLLSNLLRYEPSERMTIPEIKQHPYYEEIDWPSLVNPQM